MFDRYQPTTVAIADIGDTRAALRLAINELQDQIDDAHDMADGLSSSFPFDTFNYAVNALEAIDRQLAAKQEQAA